MTEVTGLKTGDAAICRRHFLGLALATTVGICAGCTNLDGPMWQPFDRVASARHHVQFGAWVPGGAEAARVLEKELGRPLDIEHWYQGWGAEHNNFDIDRALQVSARGAIPLVTWEPWDYRAGLDQPEYALRHIADGQFDGYIRTTAQEMRDTGGIVWLRFAHEMNRPSYPWSIGVNGNTPGDYVKAWRHVVKIFRAERSSNVQFVWCPDRPNLESVNVRWCFPGDRYLSLVGMDGYNGGTALDWGGWLSFEDVFGPLYDSVRRISRRPIIIAETGSVEQGGDKPSWIHDGMTHDLPNKFSAVQAVVWFNEAREADWRLESSDGSMSTARQVFTSGAFE